VHHDEVSVAKAAIEACSAYAGAAVVRALAGLSQQHDDDDDDCYQISPSLAAIGTAPNSVERKSLITSSTLCPFDFVLFYSSILPVNCCCCFAGTLCPVARQTKR
jgi:hypothetical protein